MIELRKPVPLSKRAASQCPYCLAFNMIYEFYDEYKIYEKEHRWWLSLREERFGYMKPRYHYPFCFKCHAPLQLASYWKKEWRKGDFEGVPPICIMPRRDK
jgi:hypothetical protein